MSNLRLRAKAIVAVRRRKQLAQDSAMALQASEEALIERLLSRVSIPTASNGKDGERGERGSDAPSMEDILAELIPLLPKSTHTTIEQKLDPADMESFVLGLLPEIQPEDRPAVERIIDVSDEKLEGFVTKKDLDKALGRVQDAITASQSGGHGLRELVHVIEVDADVTITSNQLQEDKFNVVLVNTAGITVTLPVPTPTKIVWVQQGYQGTGLFTVCRV